MGYFGRRPSPAPLSFDDVSDGGSIVIDNAGTIGSVGDSDALSIASDGDVTASQDLVVTGDLDASNITVDDGGTIGSASATSAIKIASTGFVGIGESNPQSELHVTDSTANALLRLEGSSSGNCSVAFDDQDNTNIGRITYDHSDDSLQFDTNSSERMRIDSSGKVGIATSSPNYRLSLGGSTGAKLAVFDAASIAAGLGIDMSGANFELSLFAGNSTGGSGRISFGMYNTSTAAYTQRMYILHSGAIHMPAVYSDTVTGRDLYIASNGQLGYVSSTRASKTNIQDLGGVSWLYDLNPVSFQYRKKEVDENGNATDGYTDEAEDAIEYGLIAEDVEAVNKDLVFYDETENGPELRGVQYSRLIAPLIAAVKELRQEVSVLQAELAAVKGQ